jgi:hypothetical protein
MRLARRTPRVLTLGGPPPLAGKPRLTKFYEQLVRLNSQPRRARLPVRR